MQIDFLDSCGERLLPTFKPDSLQSSLSKLSIKKSNFNDGLLQSSLSNLSNLKGNLLQSSLSNLSTFKSISLQSLTIPKLALLLLYKINYRRYLNGKYRSNQSYSY